MRSSKNKKRSAFSSLRRKLSLLGFEPKNSVFKIDEVKDESNNFFPEQSYGNYKKSVIMMVVTMLIQKIFGKKKLFFFFSVVIFFQMKGRGSIIDKKTSIVLQNIKIDQEDNAE